jgi:hypothetical protein
VSETSTEEQWFYTVDQTQQGPVSFNELKSLAGTETLRRDTLIWKEGMTDWTQASAIKALFVTPPSIPVKTEKRQPPPLPQKSLTQPPPPSLKTSTTSLSLPSSDLLILCNNCHYLGIAKLKRRGNFFVNWILMLLFVVPGIVYALWRICSPRLQSCPQCLSLNTIPAKSLAAKKVVAELNETEIGNLHTVVKKENARLTGQFIAYSILIAIPIVFVIWVILTLKSMGI